MRARCVKAFFDLEERVQRQPGDEWECAKARLEAVNAAGYGTLAEEVQAPKAKAKAREASDG